MTKYNNQFLMADVEAINEAAKKYAIGMASPEAMVNECAMEEYVDDCNSRFGKMWAEWPEMHPGLISLLLNTGIDFISAVKQEFDFITRNPTSCDEEYVAYIKGITISVV